MHRPLDTLTVFHDCAAIGRLVCVCVCVCVVVQGDKSSSVAVTTPYSLPSRFLQDP